MTRKSEDKKTKKTSARAEKPAEAMVVRGQLAAVPYDYGEDAGLGFEEQTAADLIIPFMRVLDSSTKGIAKGELNARPGDWINTVSEEIWTREDGFLFTPCMTMRRFVRWRKRDDGGGFRGQMKPDHPDVIRALEESTSFGKYRVVGEEEGKVVEYDLVETFYMYGIVSDDDGLIDPTGACIAFKSTHIAPYRSINTRFRN